MTATTNDTTTGNTPTTSTRVELEITIEAAVTDVWKALIEDTGLWWHRDFFMTKGGHRVTLEPWAGGRVFEEGEDGAALLWYQVIAIDPPRSLNLVGHLAPPYGGPATTMLHLGLESTGPERTVLRISDSAFGVVDEQWRSSVTGGWQMLFGDGLKTFVESR